MVNDALAAAAGGGVFSCWSTDAVAPADRFEYWRRKSPPSHARRVRGSTAFDCDMVMSTPVDGVMFSALDSDPVERRFGLDGCDTVLLGCVTKGAIDIWRGRRRLTTMTPRTGLLLFDCDLSCHTDTVGRYAMAYLALPGVLVRAALASDAIVVPARGMRPLGTDPLVERLMQHYVHLGANGAWLDAAAAHSLLAETRALAIAALARRAPRWRMVPSAFDTELFAAANCLLRDHIDNPAFRVADLVAAMGCSRAHLYRLFEQHDCTIAGRLQELRLQRLRVLLHARPEEAVGAIALRCGYVDLSAMRKAFRRRFDASPSAYRDWARGDHERGVERDG